MRPEESPNEVVFRGEKWIEIGHGYWLMSPAWGFHSDCLFGYRRDLDYLVPQYPLSAVEAEGWMLFDAVRPWAWTWPCVNISTALISCVCELPLLLLIR